MSVSDDAIRASWNAEPEPVAILLTLSDSSLADDLRFTDWPGDLAGAASKGLVSRSDTFDFAPFAFKAGGSSASEKARSATLTIDNLDGEIVQAVRAAVAPTVLIEVVRVGEPDDVEISFTGVRLSNVKATAPQVSFTLSPRDFASEPACHARYTIGRTPAAN